MKKRKIKITAIVLLTLMLSLNFANVYATDEISTFAICTWEHVTVHHVDIWAESKGSSGHMLYIETWETCKKCNYIGNYNSNSALVSHVYHGERDWHGAGTTHYYSADCEDCTYTYTRSVICKGPCFTTDKFNVDILNYKEKYN